MPRAVDLTGQRFGRLTVIEFAGHVAAGRERKRTWLCRCDCGASIQVIAGSLRTSNTISCGCVHKEIVGARFRTHGASNGQDGTRTYSAWLAMKARCTYPQHIGWADYGGRGITVCDRWASSYEAFLADMGPCPPGHTTDRENCNGNYEPGNCRWLPGHLQARNTRKTVRVVYNGEAIPLISACEATGLRYGSIMAMASYRKIPVQAVFDRRLARVGAA